MTDLLIVEALRRPGLGPASISVAAGDCVAVRGSSGSGKTLLLRAIADLDESAGLVRLDGQDRTEITAPIWRRQVGYVPAESGWWRDRAGDHFENEDALAELLLRLQMPAGCMNWQIGRLSTGERQRLALARALEQSPRVLLLDEPTSGLDEKTTLSVEAILHDKMALGAALILVSHNKAQVERMAVTRYMMTSGRLEAEGGK